MLEPSRRIALNISTLVIWLLFFALRIFVRYHRRRKNLGLVWMLSDIFVMIALCFVSASSLLDTWIRAERLRYDDDPWLYKGPTSLRVRALKVTLYNQFAFVSMLWAIKASFLVSYFNMVGFLSVKLKSMLKGSAVLLGATWAAMMLILGLWCRPVGRNWSMSTEFCSPQTSVSQTIVFFVLHLITDLPVIILPALILRSLQLARGEKYALGFVYIIGVVTLASSVIRFVFHLRFAHDHELSLAGVEEAIDRIYFVSLAEATMSIILVCLPSLRVLLRTIRGSRKTTEQSKSGIGHNAPSNAGLHVVDEGTFELIRKTTGETESMLSKNPRLMEIESITREYPQHQTC
ncbi:hypothetical protein EX30DRAFT_89404 [Ascodesmis nigricans]|uniref:Rhodopsin domain-containing protein n=1 Tax=Ascodesmis nigricans TaxID=341454 RepID=A0A4S2N3E9_9PEZI|nr:hypothetical protein EX30DRAFT_89404 [Ascodesmis nigricans]